MAKLVLAFHFLALITLFSCSNGQTESGKTSLSAVEFNQKLQETPTAQLIDVRTPQEYSQGFINQAVNMDYNSGQFMKLAAKLSKEEPVFVYCLSGGRSGAAASELRSAGYKQVYELVGGIMQWKASNLPLVTQSSAKQVKGMSLDEFKKKVNSDKIVIVDYYAEWCMPCKKMKPYLDEIAVDMKDQVEVIRIDVEKHPELTAAMKIDAIPVLQVYKKGEMTWTNKGFVEKTVVLEQLK